MESASSQPETPTPAPAEGPVVLTEAAVAQLKSVIEAQKMQGYVLAVRVVPGGCSGLNHDLQLVKESRPGDITWEQDGIRIATDPMSVKFIDGTEIDFVQGPYASGFKFQNPHAKQTCGCGSSFST